MNRRKKKIFIVLCAAAGVAALCAVFFWLLPTLFNEWVNEEKIEAFLEKSSGAREVVLLALIQMAQVVSIFFPGAAVQIAGGLVFGALRSFVICHLSFVGANVAVFALARRHRDRSVRSDTTRGRNTQKVLDWINSSDPTYMTMLAYMMPGIPNGFVPYAVVRTNVTLRDFVLAAYFGSLIQIAIMCAVGSRIMSGDFAISFFLVLGSLLLILILYLSKNRLIGWIQRFRQTQSGRRRG